MTVHQMLTPYNYTDGNINRIKYIVIHYVGALGGAKSNCTYYASQYVGASAHYYVDFNGDIWQSVEDKNIAWHCGAKSYKHAECRNTNSIGIELCVRNKGLQTADSKDWYFEDLTVQAAQQLTKQLMETYNVDANHVIRHYDVTGKICPNPFVYNHTKHTWKDFKASISAVEHKVGWIKNAKGWWFNNEDGSFSKDGWKVINGHMYYFNKDGYALTNWQVLPHFTTGELCDFYFEPRAGHDLECALYTTDEYGAQAPGKF